MGLISRIHDALTAPPGVRMAIVDFGGTGVDLHTLPDMAAALTYQAKNHFALPAPYGYGVGCDVRVAKNAQDVHADEWVIGLFEKPDQPGALGYHDNAPNGKPVIKVFPILDRQDGAELSVTISHEVLEALADPNGARAAQWKDGKFWAYEVCDAVENDSYRVNGIPVSNFVLPPYFEPVKALTGLKLDWMGLLHKPLEIRPGGYGQWFDPTKGWQQVVHKQQAPRPYRQRIDSRGSLRRAAFARS